MPSFNASAGVQGIGTGNPGYSVTSEKNFKTDSGMFNIYVGVGWRSNENISRGVGGMKFGLTNGVTLGVQNDGKQTNPFVTFGFGQQTVGLYLVGGKNVAYLVGTRF